MSDEKKEIQNSEPAEVKNDENLTTKDSTPNVDELIKEKESLLATIENLKGTQSAQSRTLNEYKTKLEEFSKNGITPEAISELQSKIETLDKETTRKNLLIEVATQKNIPSKALKFIQGNTKEEIESSIDEFLSISNITEKKTIPKDNSTVQKKEVNIKDEVGNFLTGIGLKK